MRCAQEESAAKVKGSDSDRHLSTLPSSSMDADSHSDDGHNSNGGHAPSAKMRKIPKLPMVRHGKKWYRARLLRDTSSRVQIGGMLARSFETDVYPSNPSCLICSCPPGMFCLRFCRVYFPSHERQTTIHAIIFFFSVLHTQTFLRHIACAFVEFTGFEEQSGPLSLPRDSDRIWRGSYKGKDWRYLVRPAVCCPGSEQAGCAEGSCI